MMRQWIVDTTEGLVDLARGDTERAVGLIASAAAALMAAGACKNVWHLLRMSDLHRVPQLTTGAADGRKDDVR